MLKPQNIHCLALNYLGVGDPDEIPLYFVKSLSAFAFTGAQVKYPAGIERMWTEVELGIIINKDCVDVDEDGAEKYIEGFTVCADVTCKNIYTRDHHLAFSKSRTNFCPVLDKVVEMPLKSLENLRLTTYINDKETQSGYIYEMKYNPGKCVSFVSKITSLKKGDIILTGTPKGVEMNTILKGDSIKHTIDEIGELFYEIV